MTGHRPIPFDRIDVVLLDVGGTLMSMDFTWIERELCARGVLCTRDQLERAEALARPIVSRENSMLLGRSQAAIGFERFLTLCFEQLKPLVGFDVEPARLVAEVAPVLKPPGESDRLWTAVLPGVTEALEGLAAMGLRLAVVSNADGTVERALERQGLRRYLEVVVDSGVVGFHKPDPRIFAHALAAMRCEPDRALHVGDMVFADVAGARSAGIHALLLDPYDDWPDADCDRMPGLLELRDRFREVRARGRPRVRPATE
jgi:HAD superfamily hydrolase (TIGR01509 family)